MADEPQTPTIEGEGLDIYDSRSYIINITFTGTINNLHIEQYGRPITVPPPAPGTPPANP